MFSYSEEKNFACRAEELFELVADVEKYPEFLPWCEATRIISSNGDTIIADLVVRYKGVYTKYTSKISLFKPTKDSNYWSIDVTQQEGPFKFLSNKWEFYWDNEKKSTCVKFFIEFEMQSRILNFTIGMMFEKLVVKMIQSFEERANAVLEKP